MGGDGITLQNLPNYDEIKSLKLVPCDEIKTLFFVPNSSFFQKIGWSNALPHIFVQVRARDLWASLTLCGSLDFLQKISS